MSASRVTLGAAAALALLVFVSVAPALAEDTCVADAPHDVEAIRGFTWTGTVVAIQKLRVDDEGIQQWTIEFAVDHVYAHVPDRDFPKGAILAPGLPFTLPNAACGDSRGDLGLAVGHRYLVSAGFIADEGIALGNLAIWRIDGQDAAIVPGLYQTSFVSPEITGVGTLAEALALLGVEQAQPKDVSPSIAPATKADSTLVFAAIAAGAALVSVAALVLLRRRGHVRTSHDIARR
jgi:hypothetical protein